MKTVTELRDELAQVFASLRAGETDCKTAAELSNLAGKMINSVKIELEYAALRKESPSIAFMEKAQ